MQLRRNQSEPDTFQISKTNKQIIKSLLQRVLGANSRRGGTRQILKCPSQSEYPVLKLSWYFKQK